MSTLAIFGGPKVRTTPFPAYRTIGKEEEEATLRVLRSGVLSRYLGTWHEDFMGGPEVRALESEWAAHFQSKHALAVNSATSGLYAALAAAGVGEGDEVIVSPYTMSASSCGPLLFGATPVFADIDPDTYCLSINSILQKITQRTKAIVIVDIFGHPFDADRLMPIAELRNITVIEDCAQAPGATLHGKYAGTLGHIGVFSLNYHKHIHSGEGGIVVTNNDELAERVSLIRNHGEAVLAAKGIEIFPPNMVGFNFRMTELEAAICREQLRKLDRLLRIRRVNVATLEAAFTDLSFLTMPVVGHGVQHSYYVHAMSYDAAKAGVHRDIFVKAVRAELSHIELRETEGVKVSGGYVKPLYYQPLYTTPDTAGRRRPGQPANPADFPVVENAYRNTLLLHELMRPGMSATDLADVSLAFHKVADSLDELAARQRDLI